LSKFAAHNVFLLRDGEGAKTKVYLTVPVSSLENKQNPVESKTDTKHQYVALYTSFSYWANRMTCGIELRITAVRFLNILFTFSHHFSTNDLIVNVADWLLFMPCLLKLAISNVNQTNNYSVEEFSWLFHCSGHVLVNNT
jgi:hypothetical protein